MTLTPEQIKATTSALEEVLKSASKITSQTDQITNDLSANQVTELLTTSPTLITGVLTAGITGLLELVNGMIAATIHLLGSLTDSSVAPQTVNIIKEYVPVQETDQAN